MQHGRFLRTTKDKHSTGSRMCSYSRSYWETSYKENLRLTALAICFLNKLCFPQFQRRYFYSKLCTQNTAIKNSLLLYISINQFEPLSSISYQIEETPHSIFMAADTLTRVKATFCHFYATLEWEKSAVRNVDACEQVRKGNLLSVFCTDTPTRKGGDLT